MRVFPAVVAGTLMLTVTSGCQHQRQSSAQLSRSDSARIAELCVEPDSVMAGAKSCELRDQGLKQVYRVRPVPLLMEHEPGAAR